MASEEEDDDTDYDADDNDSDWIDIDEDDNEEINKTSEGFKVSSFFESIFDNDFDRIRQLISEGLSFKTVDKDNDMALHFAVLNSREEVLDIFKEHMQPGDINILASVDQRSNTDGCDTALHVAVDDQVSISTFTKLLSWDADVNIVNNQGCPLVHQLFALAWESFEQFFSTEFQNHGDMAPGKSYLIKLKMLHESGADLKSKHLITGVTSFQYWCQLFNWWHERTLEDPIDLNWAFEFLELILKLGASPDDQCERPTTSLLYILQRKYKPNHVAFMDKYREIVVLIMNHIKYHEVVDINGRNMLHVCAEFTNIVGLKEVLSRYDWDPNTQDRFGLTPLHILTHNITPDERIFVKEMMLILIKHSANVNARDNHGSTPLHHSIHLRNEEAFKLLVEHGASLDLEDSQGISVRKLAEIEGVGDILKTAGILYLRERPPAVYGVTDMRFGWYYQLCCHQKYERDSTFDNETVYHENVDEWLREYPMCKHNQGAILQNCNAYITKAYQEEWSLSTKDGMESQREIFELMERISKSLGSMEALLKSSVIFGGSTAEDTKIGSADEFDFVFDFHNLVEFVQIEMAEIPGFAKLRIKDRELPKVLQGCSKHGYLSRSEISKVIHVSIDKCLRNIELWEDTNVFNEWSTLDAIGRGYDIGQLNLIRHGPFTKRQPIDVDIVPAIRIECCVPDICETVPQRYKSLIEEFGCAVVMKHDHHAVADFFKVDDDELQEDAKYHRIKELEDVLFRISFSHVEHAIMREVPRNVRLGYKIAKSVQLQVPTLGFDVIDINEFGIEQNTLDVEMPQIITSYVLKTALLKVMENEGMLIDVQTDLLIPDKWNKRVLDSLEVALIDDTNIALVESALAWAKKIYENILHNLENNESFVGYFQRHKTTDVDIQEGGITFCKTALVLLNQYHMKPDR